MENKKENISIVETLKYINENISEINAEFHDEFKRLITDGAKFLRESAGHCLTCGGEGHYGTIEGDYVDYKIICDECEGLGF